MKNAGLILNIILLVAVAALFYLHFSGKRSSSPVVKSSSKNEPLSTSDFRVAYFEMDSVESSYAKVKDVTKELNEKEQALTNQLSRLEKSLYEKANEYQSKAGSMSQTESEAATNDMGRRRRDLDLQKEKAQQEYQNLSFRKTNEIKQDIQDFLKEYNKSKGYAYIFSNEAGFMYYKDTIYNITSDVIKGLNKMYTKKK